MRKSAVISISILMALFAALYLQTKRTAGQSKSAANSSFDPHDLSGDWMSYRPADLPALNRAYNFGPSFDPYNKNPEPPLTQWGKEHLLEKTFAHGGLGDKPATQDPNGVPANDPQGAFPGKDCAPLAAPAQFNFTASYPVEFVMTPTRIYQIFEDHRELRVFWLNRDHPRNPIPSYMGDSVAKWDGNTLVVDTIGFNGRDLISNNLGQRMSDAFHLVERYTRTEHDHLLLEMTYADPKAWGDKTWTGFENHLKLQPANAEMEEYICNEADEGNYDKRVMDDLVK
jgi:hypothetical protein